MLNIVDYSANTPANLLFTRISKIEFNLNVSLVLFSKYKHLFSQLFFDSAASSLPYDSFLITDSTIIDTESRSTGCLSLENHYNAEQQHIHNLIFNLTSAASHESSHQLRHTNKKLRSNHGPNDDLVNIADLFKFGWLLFIYIRGRFCLTHLKKNHFLG